MRGKGKWSSRGQSLSSIFAATSLPYYSVFIFFSCFILILFSFSFAVSAQKLIIKNKARNGDFKLVAGNKAADILITTDDYKVVEIAAGDFAADVERVTGFKPAIKNSSEKISSTVVIIGTLNKSSLINELVKSSKLDVSPIQNKWESFLIVTVRNPLPDIETALVIVGSDRRGTAFGVYEMSQRIGVSPWVWWADVAPEKRSDLVISKGTYVSGEPSVKYRGIFLNDEDWGLNPWAAKTFEPETGNIGPKTYAKIFELLLRLKANTCWPAMHEVTRPFNEIAGNAQTAEDYGIVMGSSHAEPMLRNNVGEWKDEKEKYNFVTNEKGVTGYWEERLKTNGRYENIYTLGMRGIHDSPIQGTKNQAERIPVLEKIIGVQRNLLSEYVNPNVEKIPQIFCPYKEVLADYRAGLKIPEDVTIVFPDDNFGYIRYFPSPEEQKRRGGFGVYYHISYLGRPLSYLWLETTPPALIHEEMSKAYDHRMRDFWILNVGDLKPAELGIEFFMQMAWDIKKWRRDNLSEYFEAWAKREFGEQNQLEIAGIMQEYYRLGFQRKPEHLQWNLPGETARPSGLSAVDNGDEIQQRLDAYDSLRKRADRLEAQIPAGKKNAFYELVAYPVRGAALANERFFAAEKSELYFKQSRSSAKVWAQRSIDADAAIKAETEYFNEKLAGGKWRLMMTPEMNPGQWTSMRSTPPKVSEAVLNIQIPEKAVLGVVVEGREAPVAENETAALPAFGRSSGETRFIDVFNRGRDGQTWTAKSNQSWIKLSPSKGDLSADARILVSIDWRKAPAGENIKGELKIESGSEKRVISISAFNPSLPKNFQGFIESNGVISIEAEHFSAQKPAGGAAWEIIPGLGKTGDSVSVFPTTAESAEPAQLQKSAPSLEYKFYTFFDGEYDARLLLIPSQPVRPGSGLRLAVGIDDEAPQLVAVDQTGADVSSPKWAQNILNQTTAGNCRLNVKSGAHILKIYMVDPGVILDKIVLSSGKLKPSYLLPPETLFK